MLQVLNNSIANDTFSGVAIAPDQLRGKPEAVALPVLANQQMRGPSHFLKAKKFSYLYHFLSVDSKNPDAQKSLFKQESLLSRVWDWREPFAEMLEDRTALGQVVRDYNDYKSNPNPRARANIKRRAAKAFKQAELEARKFYKGKEGFPLRKREIPLTFYHPIPNQKFKAPQAKLVFLPFFHFRYDFTPSFYAKYVCNINCSIEKDPCCNGYKNKLRTSVNYYGDLIFKPGKNGWPKNRKITLAIGADEFREGVGWEFVSSNNFTLLIKDNANMKHKRRSITAAKVIGTIALISLIFYCCARKNKTGVAPSDTELQSP